MLDKQLSLRDRTRRAVQREIAEAAIALFAERGFEATTIDDIAAAVGMSPRSVFRYFATKEEIVVGKFDLGAGDMLAVLRGRPAGEPVWTSLRRLFDLAEMPHQPGSAKPVHRMVFGTPALLAAYLQQLQGFQDAVVAELLVRAEAAGTPYAAEDPTLRALTAAAFGCLVAAQYAWLAADTDDLLGGYVDRAMATLVPRA